MGFSDAQLVQRLKANDRAAFEEVVTRHYQSIFRQLWHLCGDADTAADLTQETFAQAWKSLDSFAGKSAVRTWLYTIAVRTWRRWKHSNNGYEHESLDELADVLPDPALTPAEQLEIHALQDAVQDALHRLPAAYREAIVLFYVQGMKYREAADALGVPIGTVKSRLHDGLQRMKVMLEEVLEGETIR